MNQVKIGKFISSCRKDKKLTQQELAEKLGVSDRTIGNWENGRNMPDLSLFKPLCDELDITINDLLSGEKIKEDDCQEKFEENIIQTIDYTNKKINNKDNLIGVILISFGILIAITAIAIFPSESSWGSIYSIFGGIVSLIGVAKFTKKLECWKRGLCNFLYYILFMSVLFIIDFIGVININQAPRFSLEVTHEGSHIYYNTLFYDVVRCQSNTNVETWHVIKNQKYNREEIWDYCFDVKVKRFKDLVDYAKDNTSVIVISKLVDHEEDNKQYVRDLDKFSHELIKIINDDELINQVLNILERVNYPKITNSIGYSHLFQLFDEDGNLILEFRQNCIQTQEEGISIGIMNDDILKLQKLYE